MGVHTNHFKTRFKFQVLFLCFTTYYSGNFLTRLSNIVYTAIIAHNLHKMLLMATVTWSFMNLKKKKKISARYLFISLHYLIMSQHSRVGYKGFTLFWKLTGKMRAPEYTEKTRITRCVHRYHLSCRKVECKELS